MTTAPTLIPPVGPIYALWAFSASANAPSGLVPELIKQGHKNYLGDWVRSMRPDSCDEIIYSLPTGADIHGEMPFHSAQLARERGHHTLLASVPWLMRATIDSTGRKPWVYLGCLTPHIYWHNRWSAFTFSSKIHDSISPYLGPGGEPLCHIIIDTAGARDHTSFEWRAAMELQEAGFQVGYEPRPQLGTPWADQADMTGFTTERLLRNTGEDGTGVGPHWAVPFTRVAGSQVVYYMDDGPVYEVAGHLAAGHGVTFPAWRWTNGNPPPEAVAAVAMARRIVASRTRGTGEPQ